MTQAQIRRTLQRIAHHVVAEELVTEALLMKLAISRNDIGEQRRVIDAHLHQNKEWQRRFPELFPDSP